MSITSNAYLALREARRAEIIRDYDQHDCHASEMDGCSPCEEYRLEFDEPYYEEVVA